MTDDYLSFRRLLVGHVTRGEIRVRDLGVI
jgi:hypothetical protein